MLIVSYNIEISGQSETDVPNVEHRFWDHSCGRWFAAFGCGLRFLDDANDVLDEETEVIDAYYGDDVLRNKRMSFATIWQYDNEELANATYELTECIEGKKGVIRVGIRDATQEMIDELQGAIKEWHKTGQFAWLGLDIDLVFMPQS